MANRHGVVRHPNLPRHWRARVAWTVNGQRNRKLVTICPPACTTSSSHSKHPQLRAASLTEAVAHARQIKHELANRPDGFDTPVMQIVETWLERQEGTLTQDTLAGYRSNSRYVEAFFADVSIGDLSRRHVQLWRDWLINEAASVKTGRPLSPSTANAAWFLLRRVTNWATTMEWNNQSPFAGFKRIPKPDAVVTYTELEDLLRIIGHLDSSGRHEHALFLWLSFIAGGRLGEILALQWRNIDFDESTIHIDGSIGRDGVKKATKTKKSNRVLLVRDDRTMELLARWRQIKLEEARVYSGLDIRDVDPGWFIFPHRVNGPGQCCAKSTMTRHINKAARELGLEISRLLHGVRHLTASVLAAQNIDAAHRLGHANPELTRKTYTHVMNPEAEQAAAHLGQLISARRF